MKDLLILGIDTSGKTASVALTDDEKILWEKSVYTKLTHSQVILPMVSEAMKECDLTYSDLDCVAVANGPGSYTGLRIGIGAVKGMCMGCETLKCAGISTLLSLAYNCMEFDGRIVSVMKARPNIVYVGEFACDTNRIIRISADKICDEKDFFENLSTAGRIMLAGDYSGYVKEKYFAADGNVFAAGKNSRFQKASSLCLAAQQNTQLICDAEKLTVSYLQATKAEKDKAHRNEE